ncbi:MAG TPA: hypothetical protein VK623_08585 [Flavobacterium sp.]|nr:hypothetical protein [Flavobacterium sp.]
MKKYILILFVLALFVSCGADSFNNKNPYIPDYSFSVNLDTNLPSYSGLLYVSNPVYYNGTGAGARGIIVMKTGSGYNAFDRACPNQDLSSCSTMTISGINAKCACDDALYNLYTGQSPGKEYPMKQYRVEVSGTVITVYN